MKLSSFLSHEWDAFAGILAATAVLILHLVEVERNCRMRKL